MAMRIALRQAALALGRQIEILEPVAARLDRAAAPGNMQRKARRNIDGKTRAFGSGQQRNTGNSIKDGVTGAWWIALWAMRMSASPSRASTG